MPFPCECLGVVGLFLFFKKDRVAQGVLGDIHHRLIQAVVHPYPIMSGGAHPEKNHIPGFIAAFPGQDHLFLTAFFCFASALGIQNANLMVHLVSLPWLFQADHTVFAALGTERQYFPVNRLPLAGEYFGTAEILPVPDQKYPDTAVFGPDLPGGHHFRGQGLRAARLADIRPAHRAGIRCKQRAFRPAVLHDCGAHQHGTGLLCIVLRGKNALLQGKFPAAPQFQPGAALLQQSVCIPRFHLHRRVQMEIFLHLVPPRADHIL